MTFKEPEGEEAEHTKKIIDFDQIKGPRSKRIEDILNRLVAETFGNADVRQIDRVLAHNFKDYQRKAEKYPEDVQVALKFYTRVWNIIANRFNRFKKEVEKDLEYCLREFKRETRTELEKSYAPPQVGKTPQYQPPSDQKITWID